MKKNLLERASTFARLHIPKASELLAQRLRGAILRKDLAEGAPLPTEKELVEQLGVSRATVREGLRLLEADGLIATRPGRGGGTVVRRPPASGHTRALALLLQFAGTTLGELLEARRVIEPACARLAAGRVRPDQLVEMERLIEEMRASTGEPLAYLTQQVRFHLLIAHAAGNNVLRIYATSLAELTHEQMVHVPFTREDLEAGTVGCAAILEALAQRDGEWAARRLQKHLSAVEQAITRVGWPLDQQAEALEGRANGRAG
jgi:GntR family transcriptional repressor for pyruvate dehydrogenase complex